MIAKTFAGIDDAPTWALPWRFSTKLAKELKLLFLPRKEIGVLWPDPWVFLMGGCRAERTPSWRRLRFFLSGWGRFQKVQVSDQNMYSVSKPVLSCPPRLSMSMIWYVWSSGWNYGDFSKILVSRFCFDSVSVATNHAVLGWLSCFAIAGLCSE